MKHTKSLPFKEFTLRQSNLNYFLWTTELIYGIVKQQKILEQYPQNQLAWEALNHIQSEAWFPTAKDRIKGNVKNSIKYKGTIGEMMQQLDDNFVIVLWSVAVIFVADFEIYVEARFPEWWEYMQPKEGKPPPMVPAPVPLLKSLSDFYDKDEIVNIDPSITLKADLMKWIRNLYAHKGLGGIPRTKQDAEIEQWIKKVIKGNSSYTVTQAEEVVNQVIGGAVAKSRAAKRAGKNLGQEFFYAIFMFTNIHNFAVALDTNFPNRVLSQSLSD